MSFGSCECGDPVPDGSSSLICDPGSTQVCPCGNNNGLQTCNAWGTAWGECICDAPDTTSTTDAGSDADTSMDPNGVCNARTKVIWLWSKTGALVYFDPATDTIQSVGTLNCGAGIADTTFSMAVDQFANAYVLHSEHRRRKLYVTREHLRSGRLWFLRHGLCGRRRERYD
jgi:hypothetical protein